MSRPPASAAPSRNSGSDTPQGYVVHLRLSRFMFETADATSVSGGRSSTPKLNGGRLFAVQWSRCGGRRSGTLGRTRFVRSTEATATSGAVADFVNHTASFTIEEAALEKPADRVVLFQLVSRDGSALGANRSNTDPSNSFVSHPASPNDAVVVAAGTIDLNMFREARPRSYALTLESNFFAVGNLHLWLYMTNTAKPLKTVQENAIVLHIENVIDTWHEGHLGRAREAAVTGVRTARDPVLPSSPSEVRCGLYDDGRYRLQVAMDTDVTRIPFQVASNGRVTFLATVRVKPARKVKFSLHDDKRMIAHASIKIDVLTAAGFPRDFALPLRPAEGEGSSELRINFSVREQLVTRELHSSSPNTVGEGTTQNQTSSSYNRTPTPAGATAAVSAVGPAAGASSQTSSPRPTANVSPMTHVKGNEIAVPALEKQISMESGSTSTGNPARGNRALLPPSTMPSGASNRGPTGDSPSRTMSSLEEATARRRRSNILAQRGGEDGKLERSITSLFQVMRADEAADSERRYKSLASNGSRRHRDAGRRGSSPRSRSNGKRHVSSGSASSSVSTASSRSSTSGTSSENSDDRRHRHKGGRGRRHQRDRDEDANSRRHRDGSRHRRRRGYRRRDHTSSISASSCSSCSGSGTSDSLLSTSHNAQAALRDRVRVLEGMLREAHDRIFFQQRQLHEMAAMLGLRSSSGASSSGPAAAASTMADTWRASCLDGDGALRSNPSTPRNNLWAPVH